MTIGFPTPKQAPLRFATIRTGVTEPGVTLQPHSLVRDGEAAIVVYVNKDAGNRRFLPDSIEGIPVTVILTDEFMAR